jgi:di/tricarboxylate transporter
MLEGLIGLVVLIIVVGIVVYLVRLLLNMIPMDESFRQIAWVCILLVAVLIVIARALPMLGIHTGL